jgi:hypothetical protein
MSHSTSHNHSSGSQRVEEFIDSHTDFLSHADTSDPPNTECPICLEGIEEHICIKITNLRGCEHMIGLQCLQEMLEHRPDDKKECPMCRTTWLPEVGYWQGEAPTGRTGIRGTGMSYLRPIRRQGSNAPGYRRIQQSRGPDTSRAGDRFYNSLVARHPDYFGPSREQESMRWDGSYTIPPQLTSRFVPFPVASRNSFVYTPRQADMGFQHTPSGYHYGPSYDGYGATECPHGEVSAHHLRNVGTSFGAHEWPRDSDCRCADREHCSRDHGYGSDRFGGY